MDKWNDKNNPAAGIAKAWIEIRDLATQGNPVAATIVKIDTAMKAKKRADAEGAEVPGWARETLQFMDCYQNDETENLDDALTALSAALR
ncbi:hypothetical protein [Bradyrhizobium sp. 200]|uniref:hypothetical protein n=1 Tax=Bradyrhizobium sp. 200 TaxID=2782665 RepID=UPI001FFFAF0C|nr:hypothetical protein [Bradyrhizobium sp. 200]